MSRPTAALPVALAALLASACSWVALEKGAGDVLVLPPERLGESCASLGKVTVSVLDKVGVLERHDEEVVEDLHILARNHAAKQDGDTVVPLGEVKDGARQYEVFRCMSEPAASDESKPSSSAESGVEVLPYKGGD